MGQDTRCDIGITYRCEYILENRELIEKIMRMDNISAFIGAGDDTDEVLEITDAITLDDDMFDPEVLAENAHDWYGHDDIEIIGNEVVFKVNVYEAHVRNMSRRRTGNPMYDECHNAIGMITTLQRIVAELKSFGIDENDIAIGHTFTDD
jgi:hypothetical protein